MLYRWNLP